MKSWQRLVVAAIVLAAVIAVLYWPHKPAPSTVAPPLVKLNSDQVRSLTITQPNQPTVLLTKAGSDWTMTQPYAYAADSAAVSGLLDSLGDITGAQDVGAVSNLAAFGLDHPSVVALGLADGQGIDFEFGSDTPTGGNGYLRVGASGPVKIVPSDVKEAAIKSAFQLQDKAILHFPSGQLTSLDVNDAGKKLHLDRVKSAWPTAQQTNVQSLLDSLQDGQMTAMPDPGGKQAGADGLSHPAITLSLVWQGGAAQLDIGAKKGAAEYYARNSSSPGIFTLSDYLVTNITNLIAPPKPPAVNPAGGK